MKKIRVAKWIFTYGTPFLIYAYIAYKHNHGRDQALPLINGFMLIVAIMGLILKAAYDNITWGRFALDRKSPDEARNYCLKAEDLMITALNVFAWSFIGYFCGNFL